MASLTDRLLALPHEEDIDFRALGFGEADAEAARKLLDDGTLLPEEGDGDQSWTAHDHALRLIAWISGATAVPWLIEYLEMRMLEDDQESHELISTLIERMEPDAVPRLCEQLFRPDLFEETRIDVAFQLEAFGEENDQRKQVIAAFLRILEGDPEERTLKATVIDSLLNLKATETYPAIRHAFGENLVDISINGDLEEFERAAGFREVRDTPAPNWWDRELELRRASRLSRIGPPPATGDSEAVLDYYLRLYRQPDGLQSLADLEGFLMGIILAPRIIPPSIWHHTIWGASGESGTSPILWNSEEEATAFHDALALFYNRILDRIDSGHYTPPADSPTSPTRWYTGLCHSALLWPESVHHDEDSPFLILLIAAMGYANPEELEKQRVDLKTLRRVIAVVRESRWEGPDGDLHAGAAAPYERAQPKVGRNDPCPCGSGKKYKRCCMS